MPKNNKSRKAKKRARKGTQLGAIQSVRKDLPPPTIIYVDKKRKATRRLTEDEISRIDCWCAWDRDLNS